MFTGIIETLATLTLISDQAGGKRLRFSLQTLPDPLALGDSIAINGVCLTAVAIDGHCVDFDVSPETLALTSLKQLRIGSAVNIEAAMLPNKRFGGHIVSGHVDALARIEAITPHGDYTEYGIQLPLELCRYVVKKGSITVDGVSLTINHCDESSVSVMIIPHTRQHTIFKYYQIASQVNIEVDMIARYVENFMGTHA